MSTQTSTKDHETTTQETQAGGNKFAPLRAKLIFNPASGVPDESPLQLLDILDRLQSLNILPEVHLVRADSNLGEITNDAVRRGIKLIIACGGDGTIDSVVSGMVGSNAVLGVIPSGTQNNVARSLGIPTGDLAAAVELLRNGKTLKVDVGQAHVGGVSRWFLESTTVGLLSALFPAADNLQHGNLASIGELLATLVTSAASKLRLSLDRGRHRLETQGHVVLISNMPYIGPQFQVAPGIAYDDGLLDVVVYSDLSKLDLISYAVQAGVGAPKDPRIQHFRASTITVHADPYMPVMADGFTLGEGDLRVTVKRQALPVLANPTTIVK